MPQLSAPVLAGRTGELDRLVAAVLAPPAVALVEGEAGIGKSRLVAEACAHPDVAGRRVIAGGCRPLREPFPLGPFVEALRGLAGDLSGAALSPVTGALRPLLPELGAVLPPRPDPLDDRIAERHRVFRGLVDVLTALAPAVFVLEDAHWADGQTVDFLSYLLGDPPTGLAMVLTFRGDEVDPAVRALTARLPGAVRRTHLLLAPLDAAGTGALAAAVLGTDRVSAEFAEYLCRRSNGLPFAAQELLALLRARGELVRHGSGWARKALDELDVPAGIREPVRERVARLSADARSVLAAAAVLQQSVPVPVLAATCDGTAGGLAAAVESGLLVEQDGGIGFRHVLAAQTVYDDLPAPRRRELHDLAASAIRRQQPVPLGQLAHHLRHAGRLDGWVAVAEQAAERAVELGDDAEAARLLEEVLRYGPPDSDRRGAIAVKLAWTADAVHLGPEVRELLMDVLDREPARPVRGELRFLVYALLTDPNDNRETFRREIAAALKDLDRPDLRAWAMMGLGAPIARGVPLSEYRMWLHRALDCLPDVVDPAFVAFVLGKVAMVLVAIGDPAWRGLIDELIDRTGGVPRGRREVKAYLSAAGEVCLSGHHEAAARLLECAVAGVARAESRWLELRVETAAIELDLCRGAWAGLLERLDPILEELSDDPPNRIEADVTASFFAVARGDLDSALPRLVEQLRYLDVDQALPTLSLALPALTRILVARGEMDAALAPVDRYVAGLENHGSWPSAARVLPTFVEAFAAAGRLADGRALVDRFARGFAGLDAPLAEAALGHARGILDAAAGRPTAAAVHLLAAARAYEARLCPYEAAQATERAAAALFAANQPGDAPLRAALDAYEGLGATWDLQRAASLARRYGVGLPARHRGGPRGYGDALSPRERQVAELAATGRTNKEIAAELYLSPNTVEKHLAAALRKLGLRTRTALAHHLLGMNGGFPP